MKKYILYSIIMFLFISGINTTNASNIEFFLLKEYDNKDNKAVVYSFITKKSYILDLEFTHKSFNKNDNIGKQILIDKGNDYYIDRYDKFLFTDNIEVNIMYIEEVSNNIELSKCKNEYGFYKDICNSSNTTKYTTNYTSYNTPTKLEEINIKPTDEEKINEAFEKLFEKYDNKTDTTKVKTYSTILNTLEKKQNESLSDLKNLEYMIYKINEELIVINNRNCDDIGDMLGVCTYKN